MVALGELVTQVADAALARLSHSESRHRRWNETQRHERGNGYRDSQYQPKFLKQSARGTGQKGNWYENGNKHRGGGNHRKKYLTRSGYRGGAGARALGAAALNAFKHDNGVIHNQTSCEHQSKERQNVDRKSEDPTGSQGAEQGNRDRNSRDQRQTHRAGEEPDGADDDQDGYQ